LFPLKVVKQHENSSQIAWKIVPLRHFFPLKVVPLIEVLLYKNEKVDICLIPRFEASFLTRSSSCMFYRQVQACSLVPSQRCFLSKTCGSQRA
jgi:hypothetical protein